MAEAEDARSLCTGTYSAWLKKVKSDGAKAKWISSMTKRYFTIDFDSQLFFYSHSEDQKKVSQPIRFKEIVGAERLPPKKNKFRKGSYDCGFVLRTTERNFELYTTTNPDAVQWVHGLNAARDKVAEDKNTAVPEVAEAAQASPPQPEKEKVNLCSAPIWTIEKPIRSGSEECVAEARVENSARDEDAMTDAAVAAPNPTAERVAAGDSTTEALSDSVGHEGAHRESNSASGDSSSPVSKEVIADKPTTELHAGAQEASGQLGSPKAAADLQAPLPERPRAPKVLPALSVRPGAVTAPGAPAGQAVSDQHQHEVKLLVTRPGVRRAADLENEDSPLLASAESAAQPLDEDQQLSTPVSHNLKSVGELQSPFNATDASSPIEPAIGCIAPAGDSMNARSEQNLSVGLARGAPVRPSSAASAGQCDLSAASLEYSIGSGSLRDTVVSQKDDKGVLMLPEEDTEESSAAASSTVENAVTTAALVPQNATEELATATSAVANPSAVADQTESQVIGEQQNKAPLIEKSLDLDSSKAISIDAAHGEDTEQPEATAAHDDALNGDAAQSEAAAADDNGDSSAVQPQAISEVDAIDHDDKVEDEPSKAKPSGWDSDDDEHHALDHAEQQDKVTRDTADAPPQTHASAAEREDRSCTQDLNDEVQDEPSGWDSEDEAQPNAQCRAKAAEVALPAGARKQEAEAATPAAQSDVHEAVNPKPDNAWEAQDVSRQPAEVRSSTDAEIEMENGSDTEEKFVEPSGWDSDFEADARPAPAGAKKEPSGWDSDLEADAQPAPASASKDSPLSPSGWDDSDDESSDGEEVPLKDAACGAPQQPADAFVSAKADAAMGEVDKLVGMVLSADANTPYSMGTGSASSYGFVPGLHCTGCDSQVLRIEKKIWNKDANYMFFRNNYPNVMKLRKHLEPRQDCCAYCCQCSWKSAETAATLDDVCESLKWRMVKA